MFVSIFYFVIPSPVVPVIRGKYEQVAVYAPFSSGGNKYTIIRIIRSNYGYLELSTIILKIESETPAYT